jgi:dihydroflavonol-4-reductase
MIHIGWRKLEASRSVNVESTRILAAACRRKNVRLVYVSTVDTLAASDGKAPADENAVDPIKLESAYIVSKREAEQVVLDEVQNGLDGLIVNPGFMVGPWDWKPSSGKMMLMLANMPVLFFTPTGGCSVVDVRDVAEGTISAAKHGRSGERYILAGQNKSYMDLWRLMAKVIGRRPPVRKMSNVLAKCVGGCGDLASRFMKQEAELNSAALRLGQMSHWYTSAKAEQELGYRIGDVENAVRDAWDWFQQYEYV